MSLSVFLRSAEREQQVLVERSTTAAEKRSNAETASEYKRHSKYVESTIVRCAEAYPPLIPWIE
jgi:hypothetical protein